MGGDSVPGKRSIMGGDSVPGKRSIMGGDSVPGKRSIMGGDSVPGKRGVMKHKIKIQVPVEKRGFLGFKKPSWRRTMPGWTIRLIKK